MYCPLCSSQSVVQHARLVEPLNHLSGRLRHLAEASKASREEPQRPQTAEVSFPAYDPLAGAASSHSSTESFLPLTTTSSSPQFGLHTRSSRELSGRSRSTTDETLASTKRRSSRLSKLFSSGKDAVAKSFSEDPEKPDQVSAAVQVKHEWRLDRYCFSSDGLVLILWESGQNFIFAATIPPDGSEPDTVWSWSTFEIPGLILGAGGGQGVVAGISKVFRTSNFLRD